MIEWIVGGLVVALVIAFCWSRVTLPYRRLFADAHFIEIARATAKLKTAAAEKLAAGDTDPPATLSDPRTLLTSAGLAVVYTIGKHDSEFTHHCSVSVAGRHTVNAVGQTFIAFLVEILGLPFGKAEFVIGDSTVHHVSATLSQAEHVKVVGSSAPEVSENNIAEVRRATLEARSRLPWQRLEPRRPEPMRS